MVLRALDVGGRDALFFERRTALATSARAPVLVAGELAGGMDLLESRLARAYSCSEAYSTARSHKKILCAAVLGKENEI